MLRLGLEGGKQVSLGFPIVSRAWFGITLVPPLFCISLYFYMFATIVMTFIFIFIIFLVIMFIVYFDYMLSVDTCGGTQRQNPQAHGYRSSFHSEYYQVSYPQGNMCVLFNKFVQR